MESWPAAIMRKLRFLLKKFWKRVLIPMFLGMVTVEFYYILLSSRDDYVFYEETRYVSETDYKEAPENKSLAMRAKPDDFLLKSKMHHMTVDDILDVQEGRMFAEDPRLLSHIRTLMVSPSEQKYNLTNPGQLDPSQAGQAKVIDILQGHKPGFFVECGAADGESFSNTLYLERFQNWNGLLIEAHPGEFQSLLYKRRRSYALNACLSPYSKPSMEVFRASRAYLSGLKGHVDKLHYGKNFAEASFFQNDIPVQCFPFVSILKSLGVKEVDYFSLDVEGPELEILRLIPFAEIRINLLCVEYKCQGEEWDAGDRSLNKLAEIRRFMTSTSLYQEVGIFSENWAQRDEKNGLEVLFIRKDVIGSVQLSPKNINILSSVMTKLNSNLFQEVGRGKWEEGELLQRDQMQMREALQQPVALQMMQPQEQPVVPSTKDKYQNIKDQSEDEEDEFAEISFEGFD